MVSASIVLMLALGQGGGVTSQPPSLFGAPWAAVELAGPVVPAEPAASQPSLEFVANGRIAGTDGCNRISGPYTVADDRISFGPIAATRMACPGADDVGRRVHAALNGARRWRIEGGRLELRDDAGATLAIFAQRRAASTPAPPARLESQVYDWSALKAVAIPNGDRRMVLDGPTATVDLLHVHVTSLAVGQVSGEAVRHPRDEVLIVKEGEVEVSLDGKARNAGPGAILFFASGAVTRLKNIGTGPATYYVIYYETPKTPSR
jgi:heat shock protein HslJ/quercetin dioxygenase-like cupin family protein